MLKTKVITTQDLPTSSVCECRILYEQFPWLGEIATKHVLPTVGKLPAPSLKNLDVLCNSMCLDTAQQASHVLCHL